MTLGDPQLSASIEQNNAGGGQNSKLELENQELKQELKESDEELAKLKNQYIRIRQLEDEMDNMGKIDNVGTMRSSYIWTKEEDEMITASVQKGISKWSGIGTPIRSAEFAILTSVCPLQLHLFRAGSEGSAENGGLTISIQRSRRVTGPTTAIVR
jgi:hypothetical protein